MLASYIIIISEFYFEILLLVQFLLTANIQEMHYCIIEHPKWIWYETFACLLSKL